MGTNRAVTVLRAARKVQCDAQPLQPAKRHPRAGAADNLTVVPAGTARENVCEQPPRTRPLTLPRPIIRTVTIATSATKTARTDLAPPVVSPESKEVSVVFKWIHSRRRKRQQDFVPEPERVERDSGEEEYESQEEDEREVGPSGMTRAKTDNI